jgi:hypothetical protein
VSRDPRLFASRELLLRVLGGEITQESDPMYWDDDAVLFAAAVVEKHDPDWLLAQLADTRWLFDARREILNYTNVLYERAYALLAREDPRIERNRPTPHSIG